MIETKINQDASPQRLLCASRRAVLVALVVATLGAKLQGSEKNTVVFTDVTVYVGNGDVIEHGVVVVRDGRIAQVGANLATPSGATVIELAGGSLTPGLIDANAAVEPTDRMMVDRRSPRQVVADLFHGAHVGHRGGVVGCCGSRCPRQLQHASGKKCPLCGFPEVRPGMAVGVRRSPMSVENSSEVIPQTRVLDSVNLGSADFERLLEGGVTTVFVAPDAGAVISSQGAIVRTGGRRGDRIVRESGAVMATMGTEPSRGGFGNNLPIGQFVNFYNRRPTTRMGVAWVFRKALYDTARFEKGEVVYGADVPSKPAMRVLRRVLAGDVALRIQARMQHDILSSIRLAGEFGLKFTLVEATEAHRCLQELKETGTPVIYGPIYIDAPGTRRFTAEVERARLHTLRALLSAGVPTALTAHELRDEDGLARQAMYAKRFGVSLADVTRCVTQTPARLLGLADEIGLVSKGKRADLVLWNGEPFGGVSRPVVVMVGGEVVLDRRKG